MGSELYQRLKHLKRSRIGAPTPGQADSEHARRSKPASRPAPQPTADPNAGAEIDDNGNGGAAELVVPGAAAAGPPPAGWQEIAAGVWRRRTQTAAESAGYLRRIVESGVSSLVPQGTDANRLVFFDAETTGLSSGAGTTAFLVGFARLTPGGIATDQLFMSDYPCEPAFLEILTSLVHAEDLLISYNGKGFDSQVLMNRFLLNGMHFPIGAQLDLLYMVRRLWKSRFPDCTLSTVERRALGITRERDLPGGEVPDRYFDYLSSANASLLDDVFAHHLQDIESLVLLLARVERIFENPAAASGIDRYQLGRMLLSQGREEGLTLLHRVVVESRSSRESVRAASELARYYRFRRESETAAGVWREVLKHHSSVSAGIELAKYLEHKVKNFAEAEALVQRLLSWPHSLAFRGELQRRLERIRRRRRR